MNNYFNINVREIQLSDINLIADYWLKSDPDFLISMGVDLDKVPTREGMTNFLTNQINTPIEKKISYALIWENNGRQIGHSNINGIEFGKQATMHLHIWKSEDRHKGIGTELVKRSLSLFFKNLDLDTIFCEPFAINNAPNKLLEKVGFEFVKKHKTIPGSINFEQEVNRWKLTRIKYGNK